MMISYITAKTFPQRLSLSTENITEMVMAPNKTVEKSNLLKDDQSMLDITVDFAPATLCVELARNLSKLEDIFQTLVKEDAELVEKVKAATSRVGTVHTASAEEEAASQPETKTLHELALEAFSGQ